MNSPARPPADDPLYALPAAARPHYATGMLLGARDFADEQTYQIVGVDEANASEGRISWIAPLSRALLKAREGGVLVRAGHTEAAVDLARLAGLYPAGALIEIMNEDEKRDREKEQQEKNAADRKEL